MNFFMLVYTLNSYKARKELEEYLGYTYNYFIDEMHDVFDLSKSEIKKLPIEEGLIGGAIRLRDQDLIVNVDFCGGNEYRDCCENCWKNGF